MKKLCILLAILMLLSSLTACGSDAATTSSDTNTDVSSQPDVSTSTTTTTQEDTTTVKNDTTTADRASLITTKTSTTTTTTKATGFTPALPMTAAVSESPLSNTYKLLTESKKLTIGYIGGSITLGTSAEKDGGNLSLSWVNRTTDWFRKQFPDADITTVNAGVSDTMTSLALYRLETTLMNTNGHAMPDLIFVEFTSNDWSLEIQGKEELRVQVESLFRRIWAINPAAEIVTLISTRNDGNARSAYIEISNHYGVPVVDAGAAMKAAMTERGHIQENGSTCYYTTDNLHPSWRGYELYLNECVKTFEKHLLGLTLKSKNLYAYGEHLKKPLCDNLITSPTLIAPRKFEFLGDAKVTNTAITVSMFNTTPTARQNPAVTPYKQQLSVTGKTNIKATFSGSTFGVLMSPSATGFRLRWRIDGGEWKEFMVNKAHSHAFMLYDRPIVFLLEYELSAGEHALELQLLPTTDNGDLQMRFGGIAVNGN